MIGLLDQTRSVSDELLALCLRFEFEGGRKEGSERSEKREARERWIDWIDWSAANEPVIASHMHHPFCRIWRICPIRPIRPIRPLIRVVSRLCLLLRTGVNKQTKQQSSTFPTVTVDRLPQPHAVPCLAMPCHASTFSVGWLFIKRASCSKYGVLLLCSRRESRRETESLRAHLYAAAFVHNPTLDVASYRIIISYP